MSFSLEIPSKTKIEEEVLEKTMPTPEVKQEISTMVQQQADAILHVDLNSFVERKEITDVIDTYGNDVMKQSKHKNDILEKDMASFSKIGGESGAVAKGLENLAIQMRDLDPSKVDFMKQGIAGKFFNPVRRYFEKYKSADTEISSIVESLEKGRKTLIHDNTTLEIEQASMRNITLSLNEKIDTAEKLEAYLSTKTGELRAINGDEEKIKFIEEEVILPLRQKILDFQQMKAVNQQGIVAMEIIRKNNKELIRSVERAENVTVSALRTAVIVAGALYNQRIVLEKVKMLNQATSDMITSTSKMLKDQGVFVQKQAIEANISVDSLKQAFNDTFSALDDISNYKQEALPLVKKTIEEFRTLTEDSRFTRFLEEPV